MSRRTEKVELTVLCMIYKEDKILLQNRKAKDWRGYTFPGGHVETGESFVEAARREMKEETGLEVQKLQLCGVKQFPIEGGRYIVFLFKTDQFSGELVSSEEGEMCWMKRSELKTVDTVEDFSELLRVFDEEALSEFQYLVDGEEWKVELH